jgi:ssDNA thymidine ADP-ribosyltransferase, DarT
MVETGLPFVFTDRNALLQTARYETEINKLPQTLDFDLLEAEYWSNTDADSTRKERRQAEFLVKGCIPLSAFLGIAVENDAVKTELASAQLAWNSKLEHVHTSTFNRPHN